MDSDSLEREGQQEDVHDAAADAPVEADAEDDGTGGSEEASSRDSGDDDTGSEHGDVDGVHGEDGEDQVAAHEITAAAPAVVDDEQQTPGLGVEDVLLRIARVWLVEQGWDPALYALGMSPLQSCPDGFGMVDVARLPAGRNTTSGMGDKDGNNNTGGGGGDGEDAEEEEEEDAASLLRQSRVLEIDIASERVDAVLAARDMRAMNRLVVEEHARRRKAEADAEAEAEAEAPASET